MGGHGVICAGLMADQRLALHFKKKKKKHPNLIIITALSRAWVLSSSHYYKTKISFVAEASSKKKTNPGTRAIKEGKVSRKQRRSRHRGSSRICSRVSRSCLRLCPPQPGGGVGAVALPQVAVSTLVWESFFCKN